MERYCCAPLVKQENQVSKKNAGNSTIMLRCRPWVSRKLCLILCGRESMCTILTSKLQIPGTFLLFGGRKGLWFSKKWWRDMGGEGKRERKNIELPRVSSVTLVDTGQKTDSQRQ